MDPLLGPGCSITFSVEVNKVDAYFLLAGLQLSNSRGWRR